MKNDQPDDRIIDVWGYVKELWAHKWVWLAVFAVFAGAGAAFALTRPAQVDASQTVLITVPAVATEAEATQQSASMASITEVVRSLALRPPFSDQVLAKHGNIKGVAGLDQAVTVKGAGMLITISASGEDKPSLTALVGDVATSLQQNLPSAMTSNPPHLRVSVSPVGQPVTVPASSGRVMLLAAGMLVAVLAATLVTGVLAARNRVG